MVITWKSHPVLIAALLAVVIAASARADISFKPVGGSLATDRSWSQQFFLNSATAYQNLGIVMIPSTATGELAGAAEDAWKLDTPEGSYSTYSAGFDLHALSAEADRATNSQRRRSDYFAIAAEAGQDFNLTVFTYDNALSAASVQTTSATWADSRWTFNTSAGVTWEQYERMLTERMLKPDEPPVVPAPSALLLGVVGLALVRGGRRLIGGAPATA